MLQNLHLIAENKGLEFSKRLHFRKPSKMVRNLDIVSLDRPDFLGLKFNLYHMVSLKKNLPTPISLDIVYETQLHVKFEAILTMF